jgi:hypothetical protein
MRKAAETAAEQQSHVHSGPNIRILLDQYRIFLLASSAFSSSNRPIEGAEGASTPFTLSIMRRRANATWRCLAGRVHSRSTGFLCRNNIGT